MADIAEHHEVRVHGKNSTFAFVADSVDGRLIIRQERQGKQSKEVCAITLGDTDELRSFFKGLRRILASLGHPVSASAEHSDPPRRQFALEGGDRRNNEREAVVAHARERNPQAFTPWTRQEEEEIQRRHRKGESIEAIARAQKRSPRAIELRLQRLGLVRPASSTQ
jgi:hypothetical protein